MDKVARITISIPGNHHAIAADVVLADLAKKLRGCELPAGTHEIIIFGDGSIAIGTAMVWEPKDRLVTPQGKLNRKAGR